MSDVESIYQENERLKERLEELSITNKNNYNDLINKTIECRRLQTKFDLYKDNVWWKYYLTIITIVVLIFLAHIFLL